MTTKRHTNTTMVYPHIYNKFLVVIISIFIVFSSASAQKQVSIDRVKLAQDKAKAEAAKQKAEAEKNKAEAAKEASKKQAKSKTIASTKAKSSSSPKKKYSNSYTAKSSGSYNTETTLSVSNNYLNISADASSQYIYVTTNGNWSIETKPANWIHASKNGNQIAINIEKNTSTNSRSDRLTIKAGNKYESVYIYQGGHTAPYLSLSQYNLNFSSNGGTQTITIDANNNWDIAVKTYQWGHLSKYGNTISIRVDANTSSVQRTDYFTIKAGGIEKRVNITQAGSYSSYNTSSSYSSYGNNPYQKNYYTYKSWWKENFSVGIDGDFETNINSESCAQIYFSFGLLTRFGQPKHTFNFITGVRYRWFKVMPSYNGIYDNGSVEYIHFGGSVCMPLNFRFNIAHVSENSRVYLGIGSELGIYLADEKYGGSMEKNFVSIYPQFGFTSRYFDASIYWKTYTQGPFVKEINSIAKEFDSSSTLGMQMAVYF